MENKNHYYKVELKKEILAAINALHPIEDLKSHYTDDCPNCREKNTFERYPQFKYGLCKDCSYEEGFEYYTTVMGNRVKDFEEILSKIKDVLKV